MAVQRNFVVRNGLEVNTSLVFTDTDNQRVGIGSTQPTTNLDVKLGGIAGTDLYMAGLSTFMNDLDCNASVVISAGASVAGFTTFTNIVQTGSGATVGFGTSVFIASGDLTIHSGDVVVGHGLSVSGISTFNGDIDLNDSLIVSMGASIAGLTTFNNTVQTGSGATVGFGTSAFISFGDLTIHQGDAVIGHGLSVAGVSSISTLHVTGDGKIDGVLRGENDTRALQVGTGVSIAGITTLAGGGGITTTGGDLFVGGDIFVSDNITLDTNLNILGIATIGTLHVTNNGKIDGVLNGENDVRALQVGTGISIAGITTLAGGGGITTTGGDLHVGGDLFIQDNVTLDTNLNLLGIATIGTLVVTGLATAHEFEATGFSTFSGDVDINASGNVSEDWVVTKDLSAGHGLSVTGFSTFTQDIDANAGLDVDGHTELDDVNIAGFSTFAQNLDINASGNVSEDWVVTKDLSAGHGLSVTGFSTFTQDIDANGGLDVDGHTELDDVNVSGMASFATGAIVTGVATATTFDGNLTGDITGNVTGVGTFTLLHVGTGGTVLQASEDGTIALGSGTTAATVTLNGGSIPSIGLVIALGG